MKLKELINILELTKLQEGYYDFDVVDSNGKDVDCVTYFDGFIVIGNDKTIEKCKKFARIGKKQ